MKKIDPRDLSRAQFEAIKPLLASARKKNGPRRKDLYTVFCAVRYLLRSGLPMRTLPKTLPKWRTLHLYWLT